LSSCEDATAISPNLPNPGCINNRCIDANAEVEAPSRHPVVSLD
jgi:hypothetical protein